MMKHSSVLRAAFWVLLAGMLHGCAATFSQAVLDQVDRTIPLGRVARAPTPFIEKGVLWGGSVLSVRNSAVTTEMQVLERPLDGDRPMMDAPSSGRFLVVFQGFVDPALYPPGTVVTVAGRVSGRRAIPMDEVEIVIPVIDAIDVHVWKPEAPPNVHFGFGFGTVIH
jgi:outer membrane lipoprotein